MITTSMFFLQYLLIFLTRGVSVSDKNKLSKRNIVITFTSLVIVALLLFVRDIKLDWIYTGIGLIISGLVTLSIHRVINEQILYDFGSILFILGQLAMIYACI
ncbi:hypothetical protein [Ezakiella peruensis]|uniref:hypothetical protein n=1 Tax=Ezakiella peruensis TaxID=1464038 RepID=UPI000C1B4FED|nr:hypothetical protein [Ezakiella peruensis]